MKTGDTVRDARGRSFQIGQLLGRGLWGRTYGARDEETGGNWIVKVPHRASDFPDSDEALAEACADIALEQGRLLESGGCPALPRLEARLALPDGTPVLVIPRANSTFEQRLSGGATLDELLGLLSGALRQVEAMAGLQSFHGNLKPTNLLVVDGGQVLLSDPVTPAFRRAFPALLRASRGGTGWCAPEVRDATSSVPFGVPSDTYSVAMMLYRAAVSSPGQDRFQELPTDGLNKARLVSLKDRVLNRLKAEHSNPRFHTRLSDRMAALLNRALSRQTSPSPPYRFRRIDELVQRIAEVQAMVHPTVTQVGRLILDQKAGRDGFLTDEPAGFSATVACTPGVEHHEEVACGLAIFDADRGERLRLDDCSYSVDRHPSGRFRFGFKIGELSPGGYRVRVAFTIRDSGDEPITAEGEFRVRAAPGYVPPRVEAAPALLPLERARDPHSAGEGRVTEPGVYAGRSAPVTQIQAPSRPMVPASEDPRDPISAGKASRGPAALRVSATVEESDEPSSADLPLPTPIAPFAPVEHRPARRPAAPAAASAAAVAVQAYEEEAYDEASAPIEDRLLLRGDRGNRPGAERARVRPDPLPDGPLPGTHNRAPLRPNSSPAAPPRVAMPAMASASAGSGPLAPASARPAPQLAPHPGPLLADAPMSSPAVAATGASTPARSGGTPLGSGPSLRSLPSRPALREPLRQPPAPPAEPAFTGAGRWSELPLPIHDDLDLPDPGRGPAIDLPETSLDPASDDFGGEQGPVGALISRFIDTVRGDAYVMFIGAAAVVIVLLTILLVALKG